jgi:hypothetical protein
MNSPVQEQVEDLLKEHGAVLTRTRKHNVWKFPDGRTFTTAKTASDLHSWANSLQQLKRHSYCRLR